MISIGPLQPEDNEIKIQCVGSLNNHDSDKVETMMKFIQEEHKHRKQGHGFGGGQNYFLELELRLLTHSWDLIMMPIKI